MALTDDTDPERGARIANARTQANLTPDQVAERLGHRRLRRTPEDVARWEAGEPLTTRELQGLGRVLGESHRYIETGVEDTGVRIARLRSQLGIDQADLGRRMDVSERNVQLWEGGGNILRKHVAPLARVLESTPEYILFGADAVPAANGNGAAEDDEDRRQGGGMRGFDDVARRIDDLRGEDPDATVSSLRADVRTLREQVQELVRAVHELRRQSRARGRSDTDDSQREGRGEQ